MKIFISAVSSEFLSYRLRLANALGAIRNPEFEVLVQEDFRIGDPTLLSHIADLIGQADLVIQLVGNRCGYCPSEEHIQAMYAHIGQPSPDMIPDRSATQWEYYLARMLGKRTLVYAAEEVALVGVLAPEEAAEATALQTAYKGALHEAGQFTKPFSNHNALVREVFFDLGLNPETAKPNNLPYKSIGSLFKGRDEFLAQIKNTLGTICHTGHQRAAAITGAPSTAIHGLGGIGKTRAAVEYGHSNADDYTAMLYVRADSPENLQANLASLCGAAVLDLPQKDAKETEEQVTAVLQWLTTHPGWFLIFDNVDTEEAALAVEELLARLSAHGQVLITSRLSNWSDDVQDLQLDVLGLEDAVDYLLESTTSKRRSSGTDSSDAAELATMLGQLPLALTQASAYIRELGLSFRGYLQKWNESHDKVIRWFDVRQMKYPMSVAVTWETSFEQLTDDTRQLLRILSFFAPDPIPTSILQLPVPEVDGQPEISADSLEEAEAQLKRYSLITRDVDAAAFSVHRLVQDVTRSGMPIGKKSVALGQALHWLNVAFVGDPQDTDSWPRLSALAPHTVAVALQAAELAANGTESRLLNDCGLLYHTQNRISAAEPLYRKALEIDEARLGLEHPDVAIRLSNLAGLLFITGRHAEAEPMLRRALSIDEAYFGTDHPAVAIRLNNLAGLYHTVSNNIEAEPLYYRALSINEGWFGPNHPSVARTLNNIAGLMLATHRPLQAEPLLRRALLVDESYYGLNHTEVATDLNNLAQLLKVTSRLAEAEPLMKRVVIIFDALSREIGFPHPHLAGAVNNYRDLLLDMGKTYDEIAATLNEIDRAYTDRAQSRPGQNMP